MAIGESVPMLDSVARVTGAVEYMVNLRLPGMLIGKIIRSSVPHARLLKVDASQAANVPGVIAVLTGADMTPQMKYGVAIKDQYPVAVDRVRFVGEPVGGLSPRGARGPGEGAGVVG